MTKQTATTRQPLWRIDISSTKSGTGVNFIRNVPLPDSANTRCFQSPDES